MIYKKIVLIYMSRIKKYIIYIICPLYKDNVPHCDISLYYKRLYLSPMMIYIIYIIKCGLIYVSYGTFHIKTHLR